MLHADRLGRPMVFQLSQDVSFGDLVTLLFNSLSDSLREPAVSIQGGSKKVSSCTVSTAYFF